MAESFQDVLGKLIKEHGMALLDNSARCNALLQDYTQGQFKKETRLLLQALEAGYYKELKNTQDPEITKQKMIQKFQDEYGSSEESADETICLLMRVLEIPVPPEYAEKNKTETEPLQFNSVNKPKPEKGKSYGCLFLIGINILVYIMLRLNPGLTSYLALNPILISRGFYWQFVTYMFAHVGISHVFFDMVTLFLFGSQVERRMGSKEFLGYYLSTGILAGGFSFVIYWFTGYNAVFLLGASGALFAVQLAYIIFFWNIMRLKVSIMVLVFTALELLSSVIDFRNGVAHLIYLTHLAGFAFGWLYFLVRFGTKPWKYPTEK
ncbi:hypothetical protein FACS1894109_06650 [Spirochaetia bacterium]|nr:hypothetical protein FACS1894109_06650 [Spirochaetia bacterium]